MKKNIIQFLLGLTACISFAYFTLGAGAPNYTPPVATAGQNQGTQTNDNAAFGDVGEFRQTIIAVGGSVVSLSNNSPANVLTLALPNGDWDVEGNINFTASGATRTATNTGITITSATIPVDGSEVNSGIVTIVITELDSVSLPRKRISLTSIAQTGGTAVAATDVITFTAHGYANGQPVYFTQLTGGSGLSVNTIYYVINTATNTFKLALTSGGAAIDITTDMTSGTVTAGTLTYAVAKCLFSAGTISGYGQICGRRVR